MADPNDSTDPGPVRAAENLDLRVRSLDSAALARLIEEVRNDGPGEPFSPTAYNRMYHRHNR